MGNIVRSLVWAGKSHAEIVATLQVEEQIFVQNLAQDLLSVVDT